MEMKLNSKLIRELRLARSWTQEQLAEKARLNVRTIQRVEMDGQGSLRTRAQLALALGVSPGELDVAGESGIDATVHASGWRTALQDYMDSMSLQALTLQLLVTLFFLASAPAFMSLARNGFSIAVMGAFSGEVRMVSSREPLSLEPSWWLLNFALWALLSAPILMWVWKRQRQWFGRACAAALVTLFLSFLRVWQPQLVLELMIQAVFFAGLALLACQWWPRVPRVHAEQLLYGCLYAYVYMWCFQILVHYGALAVLAYARGWPTPVPGGVPALLESLAVRVAGLTELLPVLCVWLLGRVKRSGGAASGLVTADREQAVDAPVKRPPGSFFEQQPLEN